MGRLSKTTNAAMRPFSLQLCEDLSAGMRRRIESTVEYALVEQIAEWQVRTRAVMTSTLEIAHYFGPRTARPGVDQGRVGSAWLVERIA